MLLLKNPFFMFLDNFIFVHSVTYVIETICAFSRTGKLLGPKTFSLQGRNLILKAMDAQKKRRYVLPY